VGTFEELSQLSTEAVNKAENAATSSGQMVIGSYRLLAFSQSLDRLL